MKKVKLKAGIERQILIGLITSDSFTRKVLPIMEINLLEMPAARIVAAWAFEYFGKYKSSPKKHIKDIFTDKSRKIKKEETKEWIDDFLQSINKEYESSDFNEELLFDRTLRYLKRQKLRSNINQIEDLLDLDKVEEADQLWIESRKIASSLDLGFDPLSITTTKELLKKEKDRITVYTGIPKLDKLTGPLKSGWLAVFMGPQKRGKTWTLLCLAVNACLQGFNVVFISLESLDVDLALRLWSMIGSLVVKMDDRDTRKTVMLDFPYYTDNDEVLYKKRKKKIMTDKNVLDAVRRFNMHSTGKLIMKVFPMHTAGPTEIDAYLDSLEAFEDFTPDVAVIDYLGIMKGVAEPRERYNLNAAYLKSMAQERKMLVAAGHQGRRETIEAFNINSEDMPEDIRILGHLDLLYGLNQTHEERVSGIFRISNLIHRHARYVPTKQVQLLQQLEAGQFALDGKLIDAKEIEEEILERE